MPILWRYLLRNFLQVFVLSVLGFVSVLLVTRFQTVARFAASGASPILILKFVLAQIPHILPMAIPISCLISSLILFKRMSHSHEITALRSTGLGFIPMGFPLAVCAILIGLLNFTIVSEISPRCRSYSKSLAYQMTVVNPLCLLQKGTLIKLKNAYIDMKLLKSGQYAEDVCLIMRNLTNQRLSLVMAKKLSLTDNLLVGDDVSFISSIDPKDPNSFDHLVIENQSEMQTQANLLSQYLVSSNWSFNYDYLNYRMIQAKLAVERGRPENAPIRAVQEIIRRFSLSLAAVAFTFVGMACGFEIGRKRKMSGTIWASLLMILYLFSFVSARALKHYLIPSLILYMLPFLCMGLFCFYYLKQVSRGVDR